jgi:hypothetical protein
MNCVPRLESRTPSRVAASLISCYGAEAAIQSGSLLVAHDVEVVAVTRLFHFARHLTVIEAEPVQATLGFVTGFIKRFLDALLLFFRASRRKAQQAQTVYRKGVNP